jgi:Domain of unknown function (DUF4397)
MKKIIGFCIVAVVLFSCGKENTFSTNFGSAAVVHASPGTAGFTVFDDTVRKTGSTVAYLTSSGYLGFQAEPGRKIRLTEDLAGTKLLGSRSSDFEFNRAATYFAYDTIPNSGGTVKFLRLSDDLSLPAAGRVKVRFAHLAVNAPAVDVTLLRTSVTPNDSVTFTNRSFVGPTPGTDVINQAQTFTEIPLGSYSVRVKLAGTQTLARTPQTVNLTATNGIYSLFATGTARSQPLTAGVFRNF